MTPNPTSAPAPQGQRQLCEEFIDRVVNLTDSEGEIEPFRRNMLADQLVLLLTVHAKSELERIADRAELEAETNETIRRNESWAWLRFAAWLREKAQ